jgi:hypothetical protein
MPMAKHLTLALIALLALGACGDSKARKEARQLARRNSCVAGELALDAKERLASLDTAAVAAQGGALQQVTEASWQFANAYKAWADAVAASADLADSAAFARSRADSLRLAGEAARSRPLPPAPGSLIANASAQYNEDVTKALGNPDHPCNKPADSD